MNVHRIEANTGAAAIEGDSPLWSIMDERNLSARKLAGMIENDEFEASMIAMNIADARQGEAVLDKGLRERIARALNVSPTVLSMGNESAAETKMPATASSSPGSSRQSTSDTPAPTADLKKDELQEQPGTTVRKPRQSQGEGHAGELSEEEIPSVRKRRVRELLKRHLGSLDQEKIQEFIDGIDFGEGKQRAGKKHFFKRTLLRVLANDPATKVTVSQAEIIATAIGQDVSKVAVAYTRWERGHMDASPAREEDEEEKPPESFSNTKLETAAGTETDHVLGDIELTGRKMSELFGGRAKVVRSGRGYEVVARSKITHEELIDYLSKNITREKLVELLLQQKSK